jgi:hypothetical protein
MRMEPMRVLVLNQRSGLILNGAAEAELRPVIEALRLRVVHGWRIKSAHLIGHDCALIDNNFFAVTRKGNSHEFVDFERQVVFPAPSLGCVLEEDGLGIATRTGQGGGQP